MNRRNYSREMDGVLSDLAEGAYLPKLLLHVCCAPCSSACLELLVPYFEVTALFFNPNIDTKKEYDFRAWELRRFIAESTLPVRSVVEPYDPKPFYDEARGLEDEPEGGKRCFRCYTLRLKRAAKYAAKEGFDYFTTTLSISPMKSAQALNDIGEVLAANYGVKYLPSDFKKKDGYKRSIELSREYGLYRQNYCGCVYSRRDDSA